MCQVFDLPVALDNTIEQRENRGQLREVGNILNYQYFTITTPSSTYTTLTFMLINFINNVNLIIIIN